MEEPRREHCISTYEIHSQCAFSAVGKTLVAPMDRVKYLLQSQGEMLRVGRLQVPFDGAWDCFRRIVAVEGFGGLFRGNIIQIVGLLPTALATSLVAIPAQSVAFEILTERTPLSEFLVNVASGVIGASAAAIISYPLDFARFRLAMDFKPHMCCRYEFRHTVDILAHPVISECPHLIYRGFSIYILGSFLYRAVFYTTFLCVAPFLPHEGSSSSVMLKQALAGYAMVSLSTVALYPLDTVRRRMMYAVTEDVFSYRSFVEACRSIAQREGPRGFYRGAAFTVARGSVTSVLALLVGVHA